MGMDADGRVHPVILLGKFHRAIKRAGAGAIAITNRKQGLDASRLCACKDILPVAIETLVLEVTMGVDEHPLFAFRYTPFARDWVGSSTQCQLHRAAVLH